MCPYVIYSFINSFPTAQGTFPNEDLWEGELRRPDAWAHRWLWEYDGTFPYVGLPVLPRDGWPLADVRAAKLQRTDALRQAWRVQRSPRPGDEQSVQNQLYQTHNRFLLKLWNGNKVNWNAAFLIALFYRSLTEQLSNKLPVLLSSSIFPTDHITLSFSFILPRKKLLLVRIDL